LVDETYEALREALERLLKGVEELEDALKKQFST
jgi:DNA-directed RNA polymerase subunit L